jgi:hypothetical protein
MPASMTSLNVVSPDINFLGQAARCMNLHRAGSLDELRHILEHRLDDAVGPAALDLSGHSTRDHHLLRLGDTPINMLDATVARFFRGLAETGILSHHGIVAVRLLGCETAVTDAGQRTLRMLWRTVNLPVFGTRKTLFKSHYNNGGFNPTFSHILVEASALSRQRRT